MQSEAARLNALTEQISKKCVGLVLNFNVKILTRDGIMRKVNGFPEE